MTRLAHHLPSLRWGERIETPLHRGPHNWAGISPHSGGGSGLKRKWHWFLLYHSTSLISPHSGGGSGLKHAAAGHAWNLPSLRWGERIETIVVTFAGKSPPPEADLPSLRWGERIETN